MQAKSSSRLCGCLSPNAWIVRSRSKLSHRRTGDVMPTRLSPGTRWPNEAPGLLSAMPASRSEQPGRGRTFLLRAPLALCHREGDGLHQDDLEGQSSCAFGLRRVALRVRLPALSRHYSASDLLRPCFRPSKSPLQDRCRGLRFWLQIPQFLISI